MGKNGPLAWWLVVVASLFFSGSVSALTDAELIAIRDGFDARRDQMLADQVADPYPSSNPVWCNQDYALAALYLNVEPNAANAAVIEACDLVLNDPCCPGACSFHWRGNLFYRIYEYFKHNSSYFPGRLTPEAEAKICEVMWFYAQSESFLADAATEPYKTWQFWSSENHTAQHYTTCWSAAAILKDVAPYNSYTYNDGSTAQQQYEAWTEFFKEYLRERAKRGLLLEIGSHTYSKYTLQGWYNFYDFAADAVLRARAGMLLDLWWADWAQDQIDGVRGGGKIRVYQKYSQSGTSDAAYAMCWYPFGLGAPASKHPGVMCLATSTYRPPLVVIDMVWDVAGRGVYESKSRRPGKRLLPIPDPLPPRVTNILDWDNGGIYRYTYCTPDFVLGSLMVEKRPHEDWMAGSSQNRWQGVIFKGAANGRIFPECVPTPEGYENTYNQHWSVQNKGTMIVQRLSTSVHAGDMRVFFSSDYLPLDEEGGWVFAEAYSAYAAVKPAWGGYVWDDENWLRCNDRDAPVIFEVARASDYMDMYAMFKSAVLGQTIDVTDDVLTYTGLGGSGTFTFYTAAGSYQLPEINGVPIDITPAHTFDSPFIHEDWASGVVTVSKDGREKVLDFNSGAAPEQCGDWGYLDGDLNGDCYVNMDDVAALAASWMESTMPAGASGAGSLTELPAGSFSDDEHTVGLWHFDSTYAEQVDPEEWATYSPDDDSANPGRDHEGRLGTYRTDVVLTAPGYDGTGNCLYIPTSLAAKTQHPIILPSFWQPEWTAVVAEGYFKPTAWKRGTLVELYDNFRVRMWDQATLELNVSVNLDYPACTVTIQTDPNTVNLDEWNYFKGSVDTSGNMKLTLNETTVTGTGFFEMKTGKPTVMIGSTKGKGWTVFEGQLDEIKLSRLAPAPVCGDLGYPAGDINSDCYANLLDFAILAADWSKCTDPQGQGCIDVSGGG